MFRHTRNTTSESVFISRFTMNNIAPKLQKCWTQKVVFKIVSKMLKQQISFTVSLLHFQRTHLQWFTFLQPFISSFMISSVAPTRSSAFYAYLITKIGKRNLNGGLYMYLYNPADRQTLRSSNFPSNILLLFLSPDV